MDQKGAVERGLRQLQSELRSPTKDTSRTVRTGRVPDDLAGPGFVTLLLYPREGALYDAAIELLLADQRFEYLDPRDAADHVWRFACEVERDRRTDFVAAFVAQHALVPHRLDCYVEIENLRTKNEVDLGPVRLAPSVPVPVLIRASRGGRIRVPIASADAVAVVAVEGTNYARMADTARWATTNALAALRTILQDPKVVRVGSPRQFRFRFGSNYVFSNGAGGFSTHEDTAWDFELSATIQASVDASPVRQLLTKTSTRLEAKAAIALGWLDRAWLETDPTTACLFSFFALEALLGDRSSGLKSETLAFRRAMLDHQASGGFSDPGRILYLYEEVRSMAVHGGAPRDVNARSVSSLRADTRRALEQYLELATDRGLRSQADLVKVLDAHPDADELRALLGSGERRTVERRRWRRLSA